MLRAVIFDLNGTILSDEDEYSLSFLRVLESLGVKPEKNFSHTKGVGLKANWEFFKEKYNLKTDLTLDELSNLTQIEYLSLLPKVRLRKGFVELVNNLRKIGVKIALASSNNYSVVQAVIDHFGIADFFDVITTMEEVSLSKPSPQIFTITAEKLGVEPYECLVFEDSKAGVEAAISAGMAVVGLARTKEDKEDLSDAHKIISGFSEFNFSEGKLIN